MGPTCFFQDYWTMLEERNHPTSYSNGSDMFPSTLLDYVRQEGWTNQTPSNAVKHHPKEYYSNGSKMILQPFWMKSEEKIELIKPHSTLLNINQKSIIQTGPVKRCFSKHFWMIMGLTNKGLYGIFFGSQGNQWIIFMHIVSNIFLTN